MGALSGAGDTLTGGAGEDVFVLGDWITGEETAVEIIDFTPADDVLMVTYADGTPSPEISIQSDGATTRVLADGTCIASFAGANAISEGSIAILPLSDAQSFAA